MWPFVCGCNSINCRHPLFNKEKTAELYDPDPSTSEHSSASQSQSQAEEATPPTAVPQKTMAAPADVAVPSPLQVDHAANNAAFITAYIAENGVTSKHRWSDIRQLGLIAASMNHRPPITLMQTELIRAIKDACKERELAAKRELEANLKEAIENANSKPKKSNLKPKSK
jgi:hypothetical protein